MKNLIIILFIFLVQSATAQIADSLKIKLSQEWVIKGYEQFGVKDEPAEEQKKDKVIFQSDNQCSITENGKTYTGTWLIEKTKTYIMCNLNNGSLKRNYKIISVKGKEAIIEYQTPDLIRTKYYMEAK